MVLAKITIKHENSSGVKGVAAYHGSVCAVYSVRVSCAVRYVDWLSHDKCSKHYFSFSTWRLHVMWRTTTLFWSYVT